MQWKWFMAILIFIQVFGVHQGRFQLTEHVKCTPLLGWFTREDRMTDNRMELTDLRPGDVLLTLSTHSMGWRHGHAGLVIDEDTVLECTSIGKNSEMVNVEHWKTYSHVVHLRVKDASKEMREQVAKYAEEHLQGVPYHLSAGWIGEKAPEIETAYFGMHCAYLVWYAWNNFGWDLDSDGGRLVTTKDILDSELLDMIECYPSNSTREDYHDLY